MSDRTLYLSEDDGVRVRVDGPSLWVERQGEEAGRRIPAKLVGRVVILGDVKISAGVVGLFAERGIPVSFCTAQGRPLATALPRMADQTMAQAARLRAAIGSDETRGRLSTWLVSRRENLVRRFLSRLGNPLAGRYRADGYREKAYQKVLDERSGDAGARRTMAGILGRMVEDEAIRAIQKLGLDVHCGIRDAREDFGLAADLAWMLQAEVDALVDGVISRRRNTRVIGGHGGQVRYDTREIVELFESRRDAFRQAIEKGLLEILDIAREV